MRRRAGRGREGVLNDWQIVGRAHRGLRLHQADGATQTNPQLVNGRYDLNYKYQNNGANVNLTGSPDYARQDRLSRRSGQRAARATSTGSSTRRRSTGPTYGSVGLESGRNPARRLPGQDRRPVDRRGTSASAASRTLQFRLDVFNVFNAVVYQRPEQHRDLSQPDGPDHRQLAVPAGRLARSGRLTPRNAGLRRGDRRAAAAEHAAAAPVRVLTVASQCRARLR